MWTTTEAELCAASARTTGWHGMWTAPAAELCAASATNAFWDRRFGTNVRVSLPARRTTKRATGTFRGSFAGATVSPAVPGAIDCILTTARSTKIAECLASSFTTGIDGLIFPEDVMTWLVCKKVYFRFQAFCNHSASILRAFCKHTAIASYLTLFFAFS